MDELNKFILEGRYIEILKNLGPLTLISALISHCIEERRDRVSILVPTELIEEYKYKFEHLLSFGISGVIVPNSQGGIILLANSFRYLGGTINERENNLHIRY